MHMTSQCLQRCHSGGTTDKKNVLAGIEIRDFQSLNFGIDNENVAAATARQNLAAAGRVEHLGSAGPVQLVAAPGADNIGRSGSGEIGQRGRRRGTGRRGIRSAEERDIVLIEGRCRGNAVENHHGTAGKINFKSGGGSMGPQGLQGSGPGRTADIKNILGRIEIGDLHPLDF